MNYSLLFSDLDSLERILTLPSGLIDRLSKEDDWSFIIKSHAIIESAITTLLLYKNDNRLENMINRLPFSGGNTSKIQLAKEYKIITEYSQEFIIAISKLRNQLVHNVRNLEFSIPKYIAQLPENDCQSLSSSISKAITANEWNNFKELAYELLNKSPKEIIQFGVLGIFAQLLFKLEPEEYTRASKKVKESDPKVSLYIFIFALLLSLRTLPIRK